MRPLVQMEITIYHKFTQHKDIRRQLLATGDAELIEVRVMCSLTFTNYKVLTDLRRIRTKTRIGAVEPMERARTSLGRLLNVSVPNCVKSDDNGDLSDM